MAQATGLVARLLGAAALMTMFASNTSSYWIWGCFRPDECPGECALQTWVDPDCIMNRPTPETPCVSFFTTCGPGHIDWHNPFSDQDACCQLGQGDCSWMVCGVMIA